MKVVLDDRVPGKASGRFRGLVLGQRVGSSVLLVLDLVPFAEGAEADLHCEQAQHMLVGGVAVVGVYEKNSVDNGRALLWKALGKGHDKNKKKKRRGDVEEQGGGDVSVVMLLGDSALKLMRFDLSSFATKEEPISFSTSNVLARMALHSAKLAFRIGVAVDDKEAAGTCLERATEAFAELIEKEVIVGPLNRDKTSLWLRQSGPLTMMEPKASLVLAGTMVGFAFVHADCSASAGEALLLEDLALSLKIRVSVMLDELDSLQEESKTPDVEHPLSRVKPSLPKNEQLKWSLPRRLLIRGASVPVCDWGFAWEPTLSWEETISRCRLMLGLETEPSDVDTSYEALNEGAFLELTGKQLAGKSKSFVPVAKQNISDSSSTKLLLIASFFFLMLAMLIWRIVA